MPAPIYFEDIEIDVDQQRFVRAGALVRLSRTEWNLLELLARNRGQVLTHRMLLHEVWGDAYSDGARDKPERHQTLRNAIDWGYHLLQPAEQTLFARLAVFGAGSTISAIETVCSLPDEPDLAQTEALWSLVEKSFAHQGAAADGTPQFGMLELLREYAAERLAERGELQLLSRRHTDYYLDLAEQAESRLRGPEQEAWLERLESAHANLRAALAAAVANSLGDTGLRMVGALWRFWAARGYVSEGVHWCTAVLALPHAAASMGRAKALNAAGGLSWSGGDFPAAGQFFSASLAAWRELANQHEIARTLNNLGGVAWRQGAYDQAWDYDQESLALRRELGDQEGLSSTLNNVGNLACIRLQYAEGQSLYAESLVLARELGDRRAAAHSLNNLGTVTFLQQAYGQAETYYRESLALFREVGDKPGIAQLLNNLGNSLLRQAQPTQSRQHYAEGLALCLTLGDRQGAAYALTGLAAVAAAGADQASVVLAVTLAAAAQQQVAALGAAWDFDERTIHDELVATARARLDPARFAAAWGAGLATSLDQAVALVRGV